MLRADGHVKVLNLELAKFEQRRLGSSPAISSRNGGGSQNMLLYEILYCRVACRLKAKH
jgi:hypothetical protein